MDILYTSYNVESNMSYGHGSTSKGCIPNDTLFHNRALIKSSALNRENGALWTEDRASSVMYWSDDVI
jgi:hypothetical protein